MKILWLAVCAFSLSSLLPAQEMDCDVTMNTDALSSEVKDNLVDFVSQLKQYVNSYRWTKEDFGNEKIRCSMTISFIGKQGENHYIAQAFIGSQRPIYKTVRSTALLRIIDDKWEFDYVRSQSMVHSDYRADPLLNFIDFYVYLILGYDADSYKDTYKAGMGTTYFQKALEIVNRSAGSGSAGKGWTVSSEVTYSRAQLIEELVNPKFQTIREADYEYHYRGLDLLNKDEAKARKNIFTALMKIAKFQRKINQRTLIIRTFFDTKYLEIADLFRKDPDPEIYTKLSAIDPAHQKSYDEAQSKR